MTSDRVKVLMHKHYESEKAYLMSETGETDDEGKAKFGVWLPKSQVNLKDYPRVLDAYTVDMPEWLAHKNGLI